MKYNKPVKKQTKTVLRKVRPNLVSLIDGVDIANEYKVAYKEGSWEEIRENYNYIMKMTDDSHLWWNKHKDYSIKRPKKKKENTHKPTKTHIKITIDAKTNKTTVVVDVIEQFKWDKWFHEEILKIPFDPWEYYKPNSPEMDALIWIEENGYDPKRHKITYTKTY